MAQKNGNLFNDGKICVYKNDCDEIFVQDVKTGVKMRINSTHKGLQFTTFNCGARVQPTVVANSIGWEVVRE